jgi:hypothetical protein
LLILSHMFLSFIIEAEITLVKVDVIVYTLRLPLINYFSQHILMDNFDNNESNNSARKSFSLKFKWYTVRFIDDSLKEKKTTIYAAFLALNIPHYYNT